MLKILFGLLLLINGVLFALQQGFLGAWPPSGSREPSRLTQQMNAGQLKLVPLPDAMPDAKPAVAPAAVTATPVATVTAPALATVQTLARADKISAVLACTEVGNFDATEAKRFETQLAALSLGNRLTRSPVQDNARFMVYIPPLASKDAADKKASELKRLGVADFFVIQDHTALQWGISLGIFKSAEAARNHLAALAQKGVHSARIGPQNPAPNKFLFQLRGLDASGKSSLDKIKGNFPHQELRDCTNQLAT
jgi:hypothetical protein